MIRCVVFDFDGTLVLSNEIKRQGFFAAVSEIPDGASRMAAILSDLPGDRYAIFNRFTEGTETNSGDLVDQYTYWCQERIVKCPERQEAGNLIAALKLTGIRVHVSSATPIAPLREIIFRRFGSEVFDGVYGGHDSKAENLRIILTRESMQPNEVAMVGDGKDDRDAANIIGCRFIGVAGGTLTSGTYDGPLIENLADLSPFLRNNANNG